MPNAQSNLFTTPDVEDAPAKMSNAALLSDAYDAAAILGMGPDERLAVFAVAKLRRQLLGSVAELARRWDMDVSA